MRPCTTKVTVAIAASDATPATSPTSSTARCTPRPTPSLLAARKGGDTEHGEIGADRPLRPIRDTPPPVELAT